MTVITEKNQVTYLKNYTPPNYLIDKVDLTFNLGEEETIVTAHSSIKRNPAAQNNNTELCLDGDELELISVSVAGKKLTAADYKLSPEKLTIANVPNEFELEIVTRIKPQENTALSGLYRSNNIFCTQCEAQGFRRITFFMDRPDVLARYTTTIIADKTRYPVLLSNGNPIKKQQLENNQHSVTWEDPFKKPSYLFALVAGDLDCLEDSFVTRSSRNIALRVYVDKGQLSKAEYSMTAVKKAMAWDETAYGREYDLDMFMIVAISDFNMGAMENKGLNIFNAKYILADNKTATDTDYEGILLVVGHEYFHNWSGNRITCRDWFQLSLKEGLTVFREQEFTADMTSTLVQRIDAVRQLRNAQFREDAGPLAHPVQPQSYIQINNFYTMTVYEKGAEVIRMMKVLVGKELFRKGMDYYFEKYDGQAVTIEELVSSIEHASGKDLSQFRLWYWQAGTPEVKVTSHFDANAKTYSLTFKQSCAPTPEQADKKPLLIPVTIGLLDAQGKDLPLQLSNETTAVGTTRVLELTKSEQTFTFININQQPVPSLLRHFSAPVKIHYQYTDAELEFLLAHDSDGFNRWEACQKLSNHVILRLVADIQQNKALHLDAEFVNTFRELLKTQKDEAFLVELLSLPGETVLSELMPVIDVDGIHQARKFVRYELAKQLYNEFMHLYLELNSDKAYKTDLHSMAKRSLKNTCLAYLMQLADAKVRDLCVQQFQQANNMTDQLAALSMFANCDCAEREEVLNSFYQQWQHEALVMDKWFAIQAGSELPGTLEKVKQLTKHSLFNLKNPNRVRSLIGAFCAGNLAQFHAADGEGYQLLADYVILIDKMNPQLAARLLNPLTFWHRYEKQRQKLMRKQLERIIATQPISTDVFEIASKSLI